MTKAINWTQWRSGERLNDLIVEKAIALADSRDAELAKITGQYPSVMFTDKGDCYHLAMEMADEYPESFEDGETAEAVFVIRTMDDESLPESTPDIEIKVKGGKVFMRMDQDAGDALIDMMANWVNGAREEELEYQQSEAGGKPVWNGGVSLTGLATMAVMKAAEELDSNLLIEWPTEDDEAQVKIEPGDLNSDHCVGATGMATQPFRVIVGGQKLFYNLHADILPDHMGHAHYGVPQRGYRSLDNLKDRIVETIRANGLLKKAA